MANTDSLYAGTLNLQQFGKREVLSGVYHLFVYFYLTTKSGANQMDHEENLIIKKKFFKDIKNCLKWF